MDNGHAEVVKLIEAAELELATSEVTQALLAVGMDGYARAFRKNGLLALSDCEELSDDDLREIGVASAEDRGIVMDRLHSDLAALVSPRHYVYDLLAPLYTYVLTSVTPQPTPKTTWYPSEVTTALENVGLRKYAVHFYKQGLTAAADCKGLTTADLKGRLGVADSADQRKLLSALADAHLTSPLGVALADLGLQQHAAALWLKGADAPADVAALTDAELKGLGITSLPHRRKMRERFGKAKAEAEATAKAEVKAKLRASLAKRMSQALLGAKAPAAAASPASPRFQYDVFLTHDWGQDELGRSNHELVSRMNKELQARGLSTWFDEERLEGQLDQLMADQLMAEGVESSRTVAVFVTQRYMQKVASRGADNCQKEFGAASRMRTVANMLPVVMEPRMLFS